MRITFLFLLAFFALAIAGPAAAAPRAPLYVGSTSKGEGISIRLTADGRRIKELRVVWSDSCSRRRSKFTVLDLTDRIKIAGGRFSATRRYLERPSRRRVSITVAGKLGPIARGTFSVRSRTRAGRFCRTGTLRWTARRVG